jgi:flagellar biosynthesis/type III secretory pathway protein FliH
MADNLTPLNEPIADKATTTREPPPLVPGATERLGHIRFNYRDDWMRAATEVELAYRDGFNIANAETERLRTSIRKFTHELLTSNDLGELATAIKESLMQDHAAALQSAHAQGRREGLEEAARVCSDLMDAEADRAGMDDDAHHRCEAFSKAEDAIRAIAQETSDE